VFAAGGKGAVLAAERRVGDELLEHAFHVLLECDSLVLVHGSREGLLLQVTSGAHAHGKRAQAQLLQVQFAVGGEAGQFAQVPVVDVLGGGQVYFVVLLQSQFEEGLELFVVGGVVCLAAHLAVRILHSGVHDLQQTLLLLGGQRVELAFVED